LDILRSMRREHVRAVVRERRGEVLALPTSCPHRWDTYRRTTTGDLWFLCDRCNSRENWTRLRRKADARQAFVETGRPFPQNGDE
jgi:hypothetical protein